MCGVIDEGGFGRRFVDWVRRRCGWRVTSTATAGKGFEVQPRRWAVKRTFAWVDKYHRLGKDHEFMTDTSEAMIHTTMIRRTVRQLHPNR